MKIANSVRTSFRTHLFRLAVSIFLFLVPLVPCWAQAGKVEAIGALTDPAVPEGIRQQLAPKGYRIALDEPTPSVEIWYRKEAPTLPE